MTDRGSSLMRRALAVVVVAIVAVIAFRMVIGALTAVFWLAALVVLAVAALWAVSTLRGAKRARAERRLQRAPTATVVRPTPPEDRLEAQMRQIKAQLREQGRL